MKTGGHSASRDAFEDGPRRRQTDTLDEGAATDEGEGYARSGSTRRPDLKSEQIRLLYTNARRGIWANLTAVFAYVALAIGSVEAVLLWSWVAVALGLLVVRHFVVSARMRGAAFPEPSTRLALEFTAGAILSGLVLAVGFLLFVPAMSDHQRSLMLIALAAMCAGAAFSLGSYRPAFYGYTLTLLLPAMVYACVLFWRDRSLVSVAETYVIGAYIVVMVIIQSNAGEFIRETLRLQAEKSRQVLDLRHVNVSLSRDRDAFQKASLTDGLTGIANRRSFDEMIEQQWTDCMARRSRLGCLIVDIDHFKGFNDSYGHDEGDRCLVKVAQAMNEVVHRRGDFLARYGGEEFVVLLSDTASAGALYVGELVRQTVEDLYIPNEGSPRTHVTVSVGASSLTPSTGRRPSDLLRRADEALYAAKSSGRNRVQLLRFDGETSTDPGPEMAGV